LVPYKWPQPEIVLTMAEIFISEDNGNHCINWGQHHNNIISREPSPAPPSSRVKTRGPHAPANTLRAIPSKDRVQRQDANHLQLQRQAAHHCVALLWFSGGTAPTGAVSGLSSCATLPVLSYDRAAVCTGWVTPPTSDRHQGRPSMSAMPPEHPKPPRKATPPSRKQNSSVPMYLISSWWRQRHTKQ
jgi:hypothetical protein